MIDQRTIETVLPEGPIFEMIGVTSDSSGRRNAAPIGVRRKGSNLTLELAADTPTALNLLASRKANICLIREPLIFAKAAFGLLPDSAFAKDHVAEMSSISGSSLIISTHLLRSKRYIKEDELGPTAFLQATLQPSEVRVTGPPMAHSRRYSAAIEAIIHTTRVLIARQRGLKEALRKYSCRARREIDRARKTGSDSATDEALELCLERLGGEGSEPHARE